MQSLAIVQVQRFVESARRAVGGDRVIHIQPLRDRSCSGGARWQRSGIRRIRQTHPCPAEPEVVLVRSAHERRSLPASRKSPILPRSRNSPCDRGWDSARSNRSVPSASTTLPNGYRRQTRGRCAYGAPNPVPVLERDRSAGKAESRRVPAHSEEFGIRGGATRQACARVAGAALPRSFHVSSSCYCPDKCRQDGQSVLVPSTCFSLRGQDARKSIDL